MSLLFSSSPGQLIKINPVNGVPLQMMQLSVEGMDIGPSYQATKKILVTGVAVSEHGNMQFLHTLDDSVYAYIFGDRIGSVRISGLCFPNASCDTVTGNTSDGFQDIITLYRANRAAAKGLPIKVSVANQVYFAFLNGMQLTSEDPARGIGQWTYDFMTLPPRTI